MTKHQRRAAPDRASLYDDITNKIIAELEDGRLPWVQPWGTAAAKAPLAMPRNASTGRSYSGINVLILWGAVIEHGYPGQAWLTFRQALALGGNVRKGERGTTVVYADRFVPDDERKRARETGEDAHAIPFLKRFTVNIIGNWNNLARIVFESFAGLGLKASGTGFTTADLLRPGKVAQTGLDAGRPLLDSISGLMGYWSFFENFIQIACMFLAWALVLLAFFILAIQLFVTLIEFKLTTLAGFVLIPFGLFGKSAFMAERVLGNVISSGIKVLVLAVIIGIGSTLFSEFTAGFGGATPSIDQAMAIVLAALSLLGLGIFGPGIANGLVSGGPQLGAGAAVGTGLAAGGVVAAGAATVGAVASGGAAAIGGAAAAARGGATLAGGASTAYSLGAAGQSGAAGVASGLGGVARAGASAAASPLKRAASRATEAMKSSFSAGAKSAFEATGGSSTAGTVGSDTEAANDAAASPSTSSRQGPPDWAKRMKRSQNITHGVQAAAHAVRSGDSHGGGSSINLSESDR